MQGLAGEIMPYLNGIILTFISLALCCNHEMSAVESKNAVRAISAVQLNSKLNSSISVTKDENGNLVSYFANGISPKDAEALLLKNAIPLSSEFTIITGTTKEGASCCYMLPSQLASQYVTEIISMDLLNGGATNIQITTQSTGKSK